MEKIPVYFMPGLAASSTIFEYIALPEDQFEMFFLEWFPPKTKETLESYALRMTKKIKHKNPVLVGVSFGGILVQEMSLLIPVKKTIIISSVKTNKEFPNRLKVAKKTMAYKLIPTSLVVNIETLVRYAFGENIVAKRIKLYEKYLSMREKSYLDWSIENVILWSRTTVDEKVVHIHGDNDGVFPIAKIKNCIVIKGGTHIMIINKFKWFNENLPTLITQ
ncbi:MAG: alpha/beta hydrolase [Flavobacterium sp.]|jgi:pimeloyl-ACP methyl ester carboxylesterase|nr:alpha/beta hydrolase [Flavobacterium sp.]